MTNKGMVSSWFTKKEMHRFEAIAEPGDMVEIERDVYSHYAIYVGRVKVDGVTGAAIIHRCNPSDQAGVLPLVSTSASSNLSNKGGVVLELLDEVVRSDKFRVNNSFDSQEPPREQSEILANAQEALMELGTIKTGEYSVHVNNCEHFATWCRNGKKHSTQVQTVENGLATAVTVLCVGAAAFIGAVLFGSRRNKKQNK